MSILDDILGNSNSSSSNVSSSSESFDFGTQTNPGLGLSLSDVLSSDNSSMGRDGGGSESSFTGIGDLGLGLQAPTGISFSGSSDQFDASQQDSAGGGGLLSGLL